MLDTSHFPDYVSLGPLESLMDRILEDGKDLSDSDVNEYADRSYEELKNGSLNVEISEKSFACPYYPKKRKREYHFKEILQHASAVGSCSSLKRSAKDKANDLALTKYLENDLENGVSPHKAVVGDDPPFDCDHDEKFVWPWIGIVVNLPTQCIEGHYVGESGSKLRDELMMRGFNPTRVHPLWTYKGHSGNAVVEFKSDWPALHDAMSFEKAYEVDQHGKMHWQTNGNRSGIYAWLARADDYYAPGIIGEHLRKIGDLKTISDIVVEEKRKTKKLVRILTTVIEDKNRHMKEIEEKVSETSIALRNVMKEKSNLHQACNEEIKKIQLSTWDHYEKIFQDHEKLKSQLESQQIELEVRVKDLEQREAQNEREKEKVFEEMKKNALKNSSLQLASLEQKKAAENVLKLAEDHKREKAQLHKKIIQLENQLNKRQALELEIEGLKGRLNVIKLIEDKDDMKAMETMGDTLKLLEEKEESLEYLEVLNHTLVVKERMSKEELQDARKELILGFHDILCHGCIGTKRMGELDNQPFFEACQRKYPKQEAEERALKLWSLWEENIQDSSWHPFEIIEDKEVINEDYRLKDLRNKLGDGVYNAVTTALLEINEYNPTGRTTILELWNHTEGRKATLKEGVSYMLIKWRSRRRSTKQQQGF